MTPFQRIRRNLLVLVQLCLLYMIAKLTSDEDLESLAALNALNETIAAGIVGEGQ